MTSEAAALALSGVGRCRGSPSRLRISAAFLVALLCFQGSSFLEVAAVRPDEQHAVPAANGSSAAAVPALARGAAKSARSGRSLLWTQQRPQVRPSASSALVERGHGVALAPTNGSAAADAAQDDGSVGQSVEMDPHKEWHRLWWLQYLLPTLIVLALVFELVHRQFVDVDWELEVATPAFLENSRLVSIPSCAWRWLFGFLLHPQRRWERWLLLAYIIFDICTGAYVNLQWTLFSGVWFNLLANPKGHIAFIWPLIANFILLTVLDTLKSVYSTYTNSWFMLNWYTWMTKYIQSRWLDRKVFYAMEIAEGDTFDNADQRISDDTRTFCDSTYSLSLGLFSNILDLFIYVPMLWRLSPPTVFGLFECRGWLLYLVILWSIGGTVLNFVIGRPLIVMSFMSERYMADYRFALARVRTNSESIAMLQAEGAESDGLNSRWEMIRRFTWERMMFVKRYDTIMRIYSHTQQFLILVILVPSYLRGDMTLGSMRMCQDALSSVKEDFQFLVSYYGDLTSWKAAVLRLQVFEDGQETSEGDGASRDASDDDPKKKKSKKSKQPWEPPAPVPAPNSAPAPGAAPAPGPGQEPAPGQGPAPEQGQTPGEEPAPEEEGPPSLLELRGHPRTLRGRPELVIRGLRVQLPTGTTLMSIPQEVRVRPGDRVLVTGPVGSGKTCFFRALAELWPNVAIDRAGALELPAQDDMLFVPRVPALPACSLRGAISYPELPGDYSDADIAEALGVVGLSGLLRPSAAAGGPAATAPAPDARAAREGAAQTLRASLDREDDWRSVLSGGEQQKLIVAHVLLRKPRWLFLDESFSAMNNQDAADLFGTMLDKLGRESTAVVSISHDMKGMLPLHSAHFAVDPATKTLVSREPAQPAA